MAINVLLEEVPRYLEKMLTYPEMSFFKPSNAVEANIFEDSTVANLALNLTVNHDIQDFKIASNDSRFGIVDDIVVEINSINKKPILYAMQLKYANRRHTILTRDSLLSSRGNFSLKAYYDNYVKLKDVVGPFKSILYTNRTIEHLLQAKTKPKEDQTGNASSLEFTDNSVKFKIHIKAQNVASFFEDTDPTCLCYGFEIEESGNLVELQQYREFFNSFSLYVTHKRNNDIQNDIIEMFHSQLGEEAISNNAARNYINFILEWSRVGGKKPKLNKPFMKSVIALFLTETHITPLDFNSPITEKQMCFRQIIEEFLCTIVHSSRADALKTIWGDRALPSREVLGRICGFFQLSTDVDDLNRTKLLWILNKAPLIVDDHEMARQAKRICETSRFIFLRDSFDSAGLGASVFYCLFNVTDPCLLDKVLTNFYCDFQGNVVMLKDLVSLDIDDMSNQEVLKIITTNELIDMMNHVMRIGYHTSVNEHFYIKRALSHNTFDYDILKNIDSNTNIIISCLKERKKLKLRFSNIELKDIEEIEESDTTDTFRTNTVVFVSKTEFSKQSFEKLTARNNMKIWHQLRDVDESYLEWVRSSTQPNKLKPLLRQNEMVLETELFRFEEDSNVNIICGEPGIGKTTLMRNLCTKRNFKTTIYFTVIIYAKSLNNFFQTTEDLRSYLLQKWRDEYNNFDFELLQFFLNVSRVRYLWDGIDEVSKQTLLVFKQKLDTFLSEGSIHWLTCRTNLTTFLENEFKILSRSILPFTEIDQKLYMQLRLTHIPEDINAVHRKIKENAKHFSYNILGIPLQIHILTELLIPEYTFMALKIGIFSTTGLYKKLIDAKFAKYQQSYDSDNFFDDVKNTRIKNYEKLAAQKYLEIANADCEEFVETVKDTGDPVGLLIQDEQNNDLDFLHASFGEYFAACYILKNRNTMVPPIKIFDLKSRNIRLFLDLMAAAPQNCNAHLAILNKNWSYVESCTNFERTQLDDLGRNIIHLFCSWGPSFPELNIPVKVISNRCLFFKDKKNVKYIIRRVDNLEIYSEKHQMYIKAFETVLSRQINIDRSDRLFNSSCFSYGEISNCFLSLGILLSHETFNLIVDADTTLPLIIYCCALFDYHKILDKCTPIPYIEISLSKNSSTTTSFLQEIVESNAVNFLKKIIQDSKYDEIFEKNKERFLSIACQKNHYEIAELCIKRGAKVEYANEDELRPIHLACQSNSFKIVSLLMEKQANIETPAGALKERPLHIACSIGAFAIVSLLVANGAELNVPNRASNRPIHLACQKGSYEIVKLLLTEGVATNKRNNDKKLPIEVAWDSEAIDIVQYFIEKEKNGITTNMYCTQFIHLACESNNYDLVELIIAKKVNINIPNSKGSRPIHIACENNAFRIVELLISSGNDSLDYLNAKGKTPLDIACENGHLPVVQTIVKNFNKTIKENNRCLYTAWKNKQYEIVNLLIKSDININKPDGRGNTLLHYASEEGNLDVVELLLEKNIDSSIPNNKGEFPIHLAWKHKYSNKYSKQHLEVVELLIRSKINSNATDANGNTSVHLACFEGAYELLQLLLESGTNQLQVENKFKDVPLLLATRNGHVKIVELLLILEARHNVVDREGNSALHIACQNGFVQIVRKLVARKVDAERRNKSGAYPIHLAWENAHYNIVHFLIANSINIAVCDSENNAPIHLVCKNKLLGSLKLLTELKVEIEVANRNQMRPIHFACLSGSDKITKILINAGANVEVADDNGNTPIHLACLSMSYEIVQILIDSNVSLECKNKEGEMPIHIACKKGAVEIVELLIEKKADITCANDFAKDTPLHLACKSKSKETVQLLIIHNAKVNVVNEYGEMPIHIACAVKSYEIVEMLIKANSKLNEKNYTNDDRPIHIACKSNALGVVLQLLAKKVSCNVYNKNGDSPLHIACRNGSLEIVSHLVIAGANAFVPNNKKQIPIALAEQGQFTSICKLLSETHLSKNSSTILT